MSHTLYKLGRFAARRPWTVIGTWVAIAVAIIGASTMFGRELTDSFDVPGLDSQAAIDLLSEANSDQAGTTAQVVLSPIGERTFFDSPEARQELEALQASLASLPNVSSTSDPSGALTAGRESAVASGSIASDGSVAIIRLQYPMTDQLDVGDLENLKELVVDARTNSSLQIEMAGELFYEFEEPESGMGEMAGVVLAAVILVVAFGSVVAMGLPIGMALFGLVIGVSSMSLVTYVIDIPSWGPQMASMIGLGVGIDYALFLVTRHREHLARGMSIEESVGRAVATAGQAVIFAGGTVVIAILGLAIAGVPFMTAAGVATSIVVLIMVLASITLLPAFLGLSGHWINRLGIHRKKTAASPTVGAAWIRWGRHVSTHAWTYAVGVTVMLLALASPVLGMQLGTADDGTKSEERTERRAYDLVADGFGAGINGPLIIAIDISTDPTVVEPLIHAVSADRGIASLAPAEVNTDAGVATLLAFPTTSPQDSATLDTLQRLRADVLPSVLDSSPARAHIGGQTASAADIGDRVISRLPLFITAVLGLSFLLLMVVFRSVLVPLKAALLNLLSIGAAYGVLVMVFQWGWGAGLIGLESTAPIDPFIPMFMFAVLFGLSMDYEVFLLSRVREEYLATGDNDASVIHGIASTARVITSAALIMISVFGGFIFGNDPTIKMFGLGLATAIFVDASIVRMILVPATMKLMGDANWWLPAWLDRLLPTIDIEGETGLPDLDIDGDLEAPETKSLVDTDPVLV